MCYGYIHYTAYNVLVDKKEHYESKISSYKELNDCSKVGKELNSFYVHYVINMNKMRRNLFFNEEDLVSKEIKHPCLN
jgi:hypothetical protein